MVGIPAERTVGISFARRELLADRRSSSPRCMQCITDDKDTRKEEICFPGDMDSA